MRLFSRRHFLMAYIVGFILFWVGLSLGARFPDLDLTLQPLPGIEHRSLLTHGILLPLLLVALARKYPHPETRLIVIGFCVGLAVHLCFDLFPRGYNGQWCDGYGCIYVPFVGRAGWVFSLLWVVAGVLGCLYIAFWLVRYAFDLVLVGCGVVLIYPDMAQAQSHIALQAFLALVVAVGLVLLLPSDGRAAVRRIVRRVRHRGYE